MKPKLLPGLALVLGGSLTALPTNAAVTNSLRVIVIPSKTDVRIKETLKVALRVENPTTTNQTVRVWSCGWDEEWKTSNTNLSWTGWDCTKNNIRDVGIPPGDAYTNQMDMIISQPISEKTLSFRMGFTAIGSTNTLWSNEVQLHILPPDTWRSGGKYYRDRNHDGKIDWEVSGTTWMGHYVYPYRYITNSVGTVMATLDVIGQGVDIYKVDTKYDGFYDLEYGAGGTNGLIQWTTNIHERVPTVGKKFVLVSKESWMDYWMPK